MASVNQYPWLKTCRLAAGPPRKGFCWWCQKPLMGMQRKWCCENHGIEYLENHHWSFAREAAVTRDRGKCVVPGCEVRHGLEVNHIKPVNGNRSNGCHNHLDGLETMCHQHHLEETARQRAAGLIRNRKRSRKTRRR